MTDDWDEAFNALSERTKRDLLTHTIHAPPDPMVSANLCALSTQLCISEIIAKRDGSRIEQAEEFVRGADELSIGVERLGAAARDSTLAAMSRQADAFAVVLIDLMIATP